MDNFISILVAKKKKTFQLHSNIYIEVIKKTKNNTITCNTLAFNNKTFI